MRSPSLFSPQRQARYEKSSNPNGFTNFQTTAQFNTKQLADYRRDVRTNVSSREPFTVQEKSSSLFGSWSKAEKAVQEQMQGTRKSPKKNAKLLGGLNFEEIFISRGPKQNNKAKVDQLFKRSPTSDSYFDNSFTSFPKPPAKQNTIGSGYKDSPQKSQQKLERFKNWDNRLDVQLILQNKSISNKISPLGDKPSFYKYVNETSKGLFDNNQNNFLSAKSNRNNLFDNPKQTFSFKDNVPAAPKQQPLFPRNQSPQLSNRYVEKFPLTDIVRMTSHFQSLSTQEVTSIPKGYVSELNNLADTLQRIVKRSNYIS